MSLSDVIDVRHLLPTRPGGGPGQKFAPKTGVVIHYSGPPVNRRRDTVDILREYAAFHIGPYLNEAGIAYHYDIGNDAGVRLCRNPDAVLWHCGSWPENASHTAVHVMLGGDQRATPEQLAALRTLLDDLCARDGFGREAVIGHQEVSSTDCPGTLMADFVYPYRAGKDEPMSDFYFFPETGFGVGHAFKTFWQRNGGLRIFGYPLSNEMDEEFMVDEQPRMITVQYFERACFEWWPENPPDHQVLLRRLGAEALERRA